MALKQTENTLLGDTAADSLLGGRVLLHQPRKGYRVAVDTLLLAAGVRAVAGARFLELGCGVGAASLCLLKRLEDRGLKDLQVTGLELQPGLAELARLNARENGLEKRFRVLSGDLKNPPPVLEPLSFDAVFFNPPYEKPGSGRPSENQVRALANHEASTSLAEWIAAAQKHLKPKGRLTLIHRADRLGEILQHLTPLAGAIRILPIHTRSDAPAKRVLVSAVKQNRAPLQLLPPFYLHDESGAYSAAATAVLRHGAALPDLEGGEP